MGYIWLSIAIVSEVFGSSMLKLTDGFKRFFPTLGVVVGYAIAFYALSLSLEELPLGAVYAIWAGVGTALTALVGVIFYKEGINFKKTVGILMVIGGIVLLNSGI
ncbi:multidrug efflux SMR transporter [Bacillus sp. AGMB 02131]|uniref:Multidrug efflux SMR transporter n=1 Tax=Peribacillus faecalis TaxID=2772559 RepID=A0A927CYU6_9BACI|nr:multidrug efflux SMR transporter [Peribacillus faecalis]MBD3109182.1 multidrug efflux SMR transporter [Peribacillus faecalis]